MKLIPILLLVLTVCVAHADTYQSGNFTVKFDIGEKTDLIVHPIEHTEVMDGTPVDYHLIKGFNVAGECLQIEIGEFPIPMQPLFEGKVDYQLSQGDGPKFKSFREVDGYKAMIGATVVNGQDLTTAAWAMDNSTIVTVTSTYKYSPLTVKFLNSLNITRSR